MPQPTQYVLDASALIALFNAEEGAVPVVRLMTMARSGEAKLHLAVINLFEVYCDFLKRGASEQEANELLDSIYSLPVSVAELVDRVWVEQAAKLKVAYKM